MRSTGDFARRHPWRQALLTGGSMGIGLTIANLIMGRPWDAIALGVGIAALVTVLIGLLLPIASRPTRTSATARRTPKGKPPPHG